MEIIRHFMLYFRNPLIVNERKQVLIVWVLRVHIIFLNFATKNPISRKRNEKINILPYARFAESKFPIGNDLSQEPELNSYAESSNVSLSKCNVC